MEVPVLRTFLIWMRCCVPQLHVPVDAGQMPHLVHFCDTEQGERFLLELIICIHTAYYSCIQQSLLLSGVEVITQGKVWHLCDYIRCANQMTSI